MFCFQCGKEIDDNSKFCKYCGANLINNTTIEIFNKINNLSGKMTIPTNMMLEDFVRELIKERWIPYTSYCLNSLRIYIDTDTIEPDKKISVKLYGPINSITENLPIGDLLNKYNTNRIIIIYREEPPQIIREHHYHHSTGDMVCLYGCPTSNKKQEDFRDGEIECSIF